ncbi:MAG: hypothetical protein J0I70_09260 [Microbacterium sp.]|uniref:glycosyltransferase n=1 Tax=Microbacterium sp. TaxID=51671 RepID=UPI001AD42735|nr:nucleotide disphospho-sugar-binding domain-containing protein [Microbacterium sp.]MBN9153218.1 hypothetical protein [Microbacterium sp.]MBN9174323.1 hypothetical protein [Microbacterium sp.]MBN9188112.1 hypothetical protein [Microbacterium sp.]
MGTIALVTFDGGGNVPPMVTIGRELTARGHRVVLVGQPRQATIASAAGFEFHPLETADFWNAGVRRSVPAAVGQAVGLLASRELGREIAARVQEAGADVALVDCLLTSGIRELGRSGAPTIVLFHTLVSYWTGSLARGPVGMLARLRGTDPTRVWATAEERIAVCDREMDSASDPTVHWVGSLERGVPHVQQPGSPRVLVSLSTAWLPGQSSAYQRIIDALADLPVRAVVTLGGVTPDRPLHAPANVEVVQRADHAALMPAAALLIGHGGHSTTMKALAHGIPLVLLPMHPLLDEPAVAEGAARLGVGCVLSRKSSAPRIRDAVVRMLADDRASGAAAEVGTRLRSSDPAGVAADLIEARA